MVLPFRKPIRIKGGGAKKTPTERKNPRIEFLIIFYPLYPGVIHRFLISYLENLNMKRNEVEKLVALLKEHLISKNTHSDVSFT